MENLLDILRKFKTIEDKIEYIHKQKIDIKLSTIRDIYESERIFSYNLFNTNVYDTINNLMRLYNCKTVLDPYCGSGYLLKSLDHNFHKTGYSQNKVDYEIAKFLNPNVDVRLNVNTDKIYTDKYDCITLNYLPNNNNNQSLFDLFNNFSDKGILILIIPDSFLNSLNFKLIREYIQSNYSLELIVKLPDNAMLSSRANFSLVLIRKDTQKDMIFLSLLNEDGTSLIDNFTNYKGKLWINKSLLSNRWDTNFYDPQFIELENKINSNVSKKLGELAEIISGCNINVIYRKISGKYLVLTPGNIKKNSLYYSDKDYYCDDLSDHVKGFNRYIVKTGDILINTLGNKIKTYLYNQNDPPAVINQNIAIIRAKDNYYINDYLESETGYEEFLKQINRRSKGGIIPRTNIGDLREILIPIFPIPNLNQLVVSSSKDRVLSESTIAKLLVKKLEDLGWDVKLEYKINNLRLDIALFQNNSFEGFIEIKSDHRDISIESLIQQINSFRIKINAKRCFAFYKGDFYEISYNSFTKLNEFPKPSINELTLYDVHYDISSKIGNEILHDYDNEVKESLQRESKTLNNLFQSLETNTQSQLIDYKYFIELIRNLVLNTNEIKETVKRTEDKVNQIHSLLQELNKDFLCIKGINNSLDDKLILLNDHLDEIVMKIQTDNNNSMDKYEKLVKQWLTVDWDKLEPLSKKYLPSAEYLYIELVKITNIDHSPFIIQYCRALENELLNKVFRAYLQKLKDLNINILEEFRWDFSKNENGRINSENTNRFANHILSCFRKDRSMWFFELGNMEIYLRNLTGNTASKSPVLKDFKNFLFNYFESTIIDLAFLDRVKHITIDYRNKAAHSNILTSIDADNG